VCATPRSEKKDRRAQKLERERERGACRLDERERERGAGGGAAGTKPPPLQLLISFLPHSPARRTNQAHAQDATHSTVDADTTVARRAPILAGRAGETHTLSLVRETEGRKRRKRALFPLLRCARALELLRRACNSAAPTVRCVLIGARGSGTEERERERETRRGEEKERAVTRAPATQI
jgi:hypothetical protein